jgi:hypothetical protein
MLCALPASSRELLVGSSRILKVPTTEGTGPGRHDRVRWRCRAHRSRHLCRLRDLARVTIADRGSGRRCPDRWQNLCRNGACIDACAHGVYAGAPIYLLDIRRCVFLDTKVAHHIKSRARNTVVRDSPIEDGPTGTSSYLIEVPNGGNVLIQGNTMEKGPHTSNPATATSLGVEVETNPPQR